MRYSMQLEKMIKQPLLLAVVAALSSAGCSDTEADGMTQNAQPSDNAPFQSRIVEIQLAENSTNPSSNESHNDSNMAAKNWDNPIGPDVHAVAPSNDVGMAAEQWRSLEQTVTYNDSNLAAENWNNPDGPNQHNVEPSDKDSMDSMAAENWRVIR